MSLQNVKYATRKKYIFVLLLKIMADGLHMVFAKSMKLIVMN